MRRVVITGIGVISPIGIGSKAFWENLIAGKVGVRRIQRFDPGGFASQIAGEVPDYKIGDYVPKSYRKATKVMARDIELAVVAADDAFKDAGLKSKAYTDTPDFDGKRFGCNIGAGLISVDLDELTSALTTSRGRGDAHNHLDLQAWGKEGINHLTPLWLLKYLPNMLACHVTIIHALKGPSNTITCSDASSHLAIGEAFRTIQRGDADFAICGGAETKVQPMGLMRQCLLKRVTEQCNESPETAVRPFDADATGTAVGEGGGLFILEEYEHAKKRGAKIYAELVGFGATQDTYKVTEPQPTGDSYGKAIAKALADANVPPAAVDLIVPCGVGIPSHDRAELNGLTTVFGGGLSRIAMSPIKSRTGNLAAGSGVDAAAAVLSLHHNQIPAALNTERPLGGVPLNVSNEARDAKLNVGVSSVYSLGGQNAAIVFRRV
jgi:3-oxoacyl-[acyl-carrier-protein] synthase II